MTTYGIGDAILKYPTLIAERDWSSPDLAPANMPRIAVHLGASEPRKVPPNPEKLIEKLLHATPNFVMLGNEYEDLPPRLHLHIDAVLRARKFIGTLSVFNVVAQVAKIPSFVFVNGSIKDPKIYDLMARNLARVCPWNTGQYTIDQLYDEAVEWAMTP
jgi:hypothetical protein